MTALRELIEAVEAGTFDASPGGARSPYFNRFMDMAEKVFPQNVTGCNVLAWNAYNRQSLDAARALHEAVLPGWWYLISGGEARATVVLGLKWHEEETRADADNPARAWLLAILKAMEATHD